MNVRRKPTENDPTMLDIAQRLTKVETVVKIGFPALGLYITLLKFAPGTVSPETPIKALNALAGLFI